MRATILMFLLFLASGVGPAAAQEETADTETSYRVILFLADDGAPTDIEVRRLSEVWNESESTERLAALLETESLHRLDDVTILPGRETPAIQIGDVTVRVQGVLKEPRRDRMFLRVEVDGGQEALVKEMISKFDETIVLAYPLARGDRSIVALIVPATLSSQP